MEKIIFGIDLNITDSPTVIAIASQQEVIKTKDLSEIAHRINNLYIEWKPIRIVIDDSIRSRHLLSLFNINHHYQLDMTCWRLYKVHPKEFFTAYTLALKVFPIATDELRKEMERYRIPKVLDTW